MNVSRIWDIPWLELAVVMPLIGVLYVRRTASPERAYRRLVAFSAATFACVTCAVSAVLAEVPYHLRPRWSVLVRIADRPLLALDDLSAAILPLIALLHLAVAISLPRRSIRHAPLALLSEAITLALFTVDDRWLLIGLSILATATPVFELLARGKTIRVYGFHTLLFVGLLMAGECLTGAGRASVFAGALLCAAVLLRCGVPPFHGWLPDLVEHLSVGSAVLFLAPLTGVLLAVRLVLPVAPESVLHATCFIAAIGAVFAAGMAIVQRELRRWFAYLFISQSCLALVGIGLSTSISLTASLCLWAGIVLAFGAMGIALRALESRFGRLSLLVQHGLYVRSPALAISFLVIGLAALGFPGSLCFNAAAMLVEGAGRAQFAVGAALALASILGSAALIRACLSLFTGPSAESSIPMRLLIGEQMALIGLIALIVGGSLIPSSGIALEHRAADAALEERLARTCPANSPPTILAQMSEATE